MPSNRGLVTHLRPRHGLDEWTDRNAKRRVPALSEHKYKYRTDPDRVWQVLALFCVAVVLALVGVL